MIRPRREIEEFEENFRYLFDNTAIAICVMNPDGVIVEINKVAEDLFGYTRDESIGKNYLDLNVYPLDVLPFIQKGYKKLLDGDISEPFDVKLYNKERRSLWVNVLPTLTKIGEKTYIQCFIQDIDERRKMEQRLKESEVRYRNMINTLDVGFFRVSIDGMVLAHNPRFNSIFGIDSREDLVGTPSFDFWLSSNDRNKFLKELKEIGYVRNYISPAKKVSGEEIVIIGNTHLIMNEDGLPIASEGTIIDITDQYNLENKLRESEDKFKLITDQSLMGICILQDDVFKYINQKYADICGYTIEEMKAWPPGGFINIIHPDDRKKVMAQADIKQAGLPSEKLDINYEFKGIKKSGEIRCVEVFANTIIYEGRPADLVTIIDITEKKKAIEIINNENERLKEIDSLRKDFINRASHELKSPITSLYGAAQQLDYFFKESLPDDAQELVNILLSSSIRLTHLINNMLDSSRIDLDQLKVKKKKSNISDLVNSTMNDMVHLMKVKELKLSSQINKDILVEIDKSKIQQVITNLLSNAIKYTPAGGEIEIRLERVDGFIDLIIKDTGIGIEKDQLSKLFKKFSRLERNGNAKRVFAEGTGLGLYISKEIMEMHDGQIWAESEGIDKGSRFIMRLPNKDENIFF